MGIMHTQQTYEVPYYVQILHLNKLSTDGICYVSMNT